MLRQGFEVTIATMRTEMLHCSFWRSHRLPFAWDRVDMPLAAKLETGDGQTQNIGRLASHPPKGEPAQPPPPRRGAESTKTTQKRAVVTSNMPKRKPHSRNGGGCFECNTMHVSNSATLDKQQTHSSDEQRPFFLNQAIVDKE